MASVIIHGFHTEEDAQTFISWFEGEGEQDQSIWFEDREAEGLDVKAQYVDCQATYKGGKPRQDDQGNWVIHLYPRT
jgi:hypothetical protein